VRRILNEFDLHIAVIVLFTLPYLYFGWSVLAVPLLLPQGMVWTHAIADLHAHGQRSWPYVVANEFMIGVLVGVAAAIKVALSAR
jgi:hypothetical protein